MKKKSRYKRVDRLHPIDPTLLKAIEHAGGMRALGRAIGATHQNIRQWKRTPASQVLKIERATGIHRSLLRPDIYPEKDYPRG
jgi:DNA-binding transcriptional regulator YdaS (Cro superfamily)